jgi:hypothetical protein
MFSSRPLELAINRLRHIQQAHVDASRHVLFATTMIQPYEDDLLMSLALPYEPFDGATACPEPSRRMVMPQGLPQPYSFRLLLAPFE